MDRFLNKRELDYALTLREAKPLTNDIQLKAWIKLRDMICNDYVRPSRWDYFREVAERGA